MSINILRSRQELAAYRTALGPAGVIALVPTMGALHRGHLSLVEQAQRYAKQVVVSIFVNPSQFGPQEDLHAYPRQLEQDAKLLEPFGPVTIFAPTVADIYPQGFQTYVVNEGLANDLCGQVRPGHFRGVCTIVLKLLQLVAPRWALFGKKDYQQWKVIEQMVKDLELNCHIIGCPLIRDADGLALSSRNQYLTPAQKPTALSLFESLKLTSEAFQAGERHVDKLISLAQEHLARFPDVSLDYLALRRQKNLLPFGAKVDGDAVLLGAIRLGSVRLIDNWELNLPQEKI